jgi:hypothetical protein
MTFSLRSLAWLTLSLVVGCASATPSPPSKPTATAADAPAAVRVDASSEASFADSALRLLRAAAPELQATVSGPLQLKVATLQSPDMRVNLDRPWHDCKEEPTACDAALRRYVSGSIPVLRERPAPATREALIPVVRSKAYFDEVGGVDHAVAEQFVGDLWVFYAVDSPASLVSLKPTDLTELGLTRDEVGRVARENLRKRLGDLPADLGQKAGAAIGLIFRDEYFESSRILLHDQWAALARASGGKLLVAIPGNDVIVFALESDPEAVTQLSKVAHDVGEKARRAVSPQVLAWTEAGWKPVGPIVR